MACTCVSNKHSSTTTDLVEQPREKGLQTAASSGVQSAYLGNPEISPAHSFVVRNKLTSSQNNPQWESWRSERNSLE